MVPDLTAALRPLIDDGLVPGLVAATARGDEVDLVVLGDRAVGGEAMTAETPFRIASVTKPIIGAVTLTLVADGTLGLDEPVATWLPELAAPRVLRTVTSPLDDTVAADRPILVGDLLRSTSGHGFPSDVAAPIVAALSERLHQGPPQPALVAPPDEWLATLAELPLVRQPGTGYAYNTPLDVLGVLLARAAGRPLDELVRERLLDPAAMTGTGFWFAPATAGRRPSYYRSGDDGLVEQDGPDGQWARPPAFPSGAGGLVSDLADLLAFGRLLLGGGGSVLPTELVDAMTSDQLTPAIRASDDLFLDGQSWGYGGGVDIAPTKPWHVPGRYGWVGGTGTSFHIVPSAGTVAVLLTQVELGGPTGSRVLETFWAAAAAR